MEMFIILSNHIKNDISEGIRDGFFTLDGKWRFVYINIQAATIVNKKAEELIGKVIWEVLPNISGTVLETVYRKAMVSRIVQRTEMRDLLAGSWYNIIAIPAAEGISVYWQEISEQKLAEAALHEYEEKYHRFINYFDKGFLLIDVIFDENDQTVDIYFMDANNAAANMLGRDYTGKHLSEIELSNESYWCEIFGRVALTGDNIWLEHYSDLDKKWLDLHVFKVGEEDRRQIGIIFQDITARKQAEKELRESQERALDLVEKLRQADQNKNEFLSILSHELRNPLASIMISLSLQNQVTPGSEEDRQARIIMERQTARLSRIVDDLLDITRINQNKIKLKKERIELNKLVKHIVANYEAQFAEKEVKLLTQLTSSQLYLEADSARLTQVIDNLLDNAAKFTEKGDKTLVTVSEDESTREAVIKVQDSGMGIQPALIPNLFQAFVQADNSLDRSRGGLGLGLAIAKGMVELHGGSVAFYSEGLGHGTQFTIRLPLSAASMNEQKQNLKEGGSSFRSLRILIIEDNPDIVEILSSLLNHIGHEVVAASSGPDGIAIAKEFYPEALICDIGLPGMSGYEVAEYFRLDQELKGVYLIALSGYAQPKDLEQSKVAGFKQHLAKPVDLDTLKKALAEVN